MSSVISQSEQIIGADEKQPLMVSCLSCRHVWVVAWMPIPMHLIQQVIPKVCPHCHTTRRAPIVMATHEAGDFQRYVTWLKAELVRANREAKELKNVRQK